MTTEFVTLTGPVKGGRKFYRQLLDMQDVLYTASLAPDTKPPDRAACARAWEVLEERKRIMRGRPLPGSLKPTERKSKARGESAAPVVYPGPSATSAPAVVNDAVTVPVNDGQTNG